MDDAGDEAGQRLSNDSKQVPGPLLTSIPLGGWRTSYSARVRPRKTAGFWLRAKLEKGKEERIYKEKKYFFSLELRVHGETR